MRQRAHAASPLRRRDPLKLAVFVWSGRRFWLGTHLHRTLVKIGCWASAGASADWEVLDSASMSGIPSNPGFDLHVERRESAAILRVSGELDITGAEVLETRTKELAGDSPDVVVIDLRKVSFMDSTGLRSLLRARALGTEEGWSLKLIRGPTPVHRVMELTRMDDHFDFADASEFD
jgi:anti-sigma B factor antagonist